MKHGINKTSVSFSIFLVIIVFLVTGVHAEEKDCEDVSGIWKSTVEIDNSDCGVPDQTINYTYELVQDGCVVTVKENKVKADVRDDKIYWPQRIIPGRRADRRRGDVLPHVVMAASFLFPFRRFP